MKTKSRRHSLHVKGRNVFVVVVVKTGVSPSTGPEFVPNKFTRLVFR
jgi:hypothetical protein